MYTARTAALRSTGYRCRHETVTGQGYYGGDGIGCYRVRDASGQLVSPISTYRSARGAWAGAASMIDYRASR